VNLNSITAYNVRSEASAYGTSKFAVLRWTEFSVEMNRRVGLIVFSVHPGATELAEAVPRET
jgi:NAD(P)-dependent dehydrogenase (short-subunit alcohol dehydrogenase family)